MVVVVVTLAVLAIASSSIASTQSTFAKMKKSSNIAGGNMMAYGHQNQTSTMMEPNITGSVAIGPMLAKAIASQVHVSLANASMIAEKAVGANAHAAAVRIGCSSRISSLHGISRG